MSSLPTNKSLTLNQRECAKILASNDIHEMTLAEVAEYIGVSERTIYRWKHDPSFVAYQNEVAEQLMEDFLSEAYVELRKIVRSSSSEKSKLKAIEMALGNRGKLKQQQDITIKQEEVYDPEQRRKEVIDMDLDSLE